MLRAQLVCEQISEQIRSYDRDDRVTPITFWALDPNRYPRAIRRKVETPSWSSVEENYGDATREAMEDLLAINDCPEERMILWHGPSGTGKTHALRALAREWSPWCNVAFITDPEEFIGGASTYSPTYLFDVANFASGHSAKEAERRSTLIVLEDAGELMAGEARQAAGQGLSRLLNLTDGLLGQGLRIMVLITTNEPLASLHPAVFRPGRCLSEIEFGNLDTDAANSWLGAHGSSVTVGRPTTLASLYAIVGGRIPSASAS
jgi:SpoVK/Ycf46/Vps4 family AAA+-type ATPase